MKLTAFIISLFAVLGITGTWLAGAGSTDETVVDEQQAELPVNIVIPSMVSSVSRQREFVGSIVAARRTRLSFERSARLVEVLADEGQQVAADQVVARIDQRQLHVQLSEFHARLRQQQAVLAELKSGPRKETIAATRAELDAMTADVELRKTTFDRSQDLYNRNANSAQALDEVRLAWKASVARRQAVERQLEELTAGTREEQIAAQAALIQATEAQIERLQIDIVDSELRVPFAGTIVRRLNDEGDMLTAQQPLFEILETGQLEAHIGVPSQLIAAVKRQDYFVLTADTLEFTGKLRNVISQVDSATRTQKVVLSIDEAHPDGVADGQLVRMQMNEPVDVDGFRVPVTSLANGTRGLWSVYVVEAESTAESDHHVVTNRVVELLHTDGEFAVVRGALYEGESIVVDGLHRIVPGQVVKPQLGLAERE